jgi:glycerol-3-phosphate acyltransferase PlsY
MYEQIVEYLRPMLGDATATNLLRHYCARMRMSVDDLKAGHMSELADAMKPMLAVWLGSAGAARVSKELAQLGGETTS